MRASEDDDVLARIPKESIAVAVLIRRLRWNAWDFRSAERFNQSVCFDGVELQEISRERLNPNVAERVIHDAGGVKAELPRAPVESPA